MTGADVPVESLTVEVRLLGPLEVVDSTGQAVPIPGERLRAIVALLALEAPRTVTTDRIIDSFWGDQQVERPELALQVAISRLRKAAGPNLILTEPGGYRLGVTNRALDVERFRHQIRRGRQQMSMGQPALATESFRQALAQWRGSALSDLRHLEFAEEAARILEEERLVGIEFLLEAEIATGNHRSLSAELSGLVEAFPLREKLWFLQMLALYRSGRQAEALRSFARVKTILAEELGVEPSDELADLEEKIVLHDPLLDRSSESSVTDLSLGDPEVVNFSSGDLIYEEGFPGDSVYWIEEGQVELSTLTGKGEKLVIALLGAGRYFGELSALLGTGRTATATAVAPVTLSIHTLEEFRQRLGVERSEEPEATVSPESIRDLVARGEYLRAYDATSDEMDKGNFDPDMRYLSVLTLARSGATSKARQRYEALELGSVDRNLLSPRLAEDIDALKGRLEKDMALAGSGENRELWARRSASSYSDAFDRHRSAYLAVNAATMWLVVGDRSMAEDRARGALAALPLQATQIVDDDTYWESVTEAEASLIIGEIDRAADALGRAGALSRDDQAARATTLRQLKIVCSLLEIDPEILTSISNPTVIHFCGHRISPSGQPGRFPNQNENRVKRELADVFEQRKVGVGYGALAAGADILAAEALLDRGSELQIVLPFDPADFVSISVAPAGPEWVSRFQSCLDRASGVVVAANGEFGDDPVLFDYANQIAMGDALVRASHLQAEAHQVAVWDGVPTDDLAGTAADVAHWQATGHPGTVIAVEGTAGRPERSSPSSGRRIATVVIGDFAGFSQLTDNQVFSFQEKVMAELARTIEGYQPHVLSGRTLGDGFNLVFDDVAVAADCAISLQMAIRGMDLDQVDLGAIRGLRIAAHVAPVFEGWDPISGSKLFFGAGVTQASRIQPRTPEGEVYVTHSFAALAMLKDGRTFDCQYVGTVPTARRYGSLPLFSLRRRADGVRKLEGG